MSSKIDGDQIEVEIAEKRQGIRASGRSEQLWNAESTYFGVPSAAHSFRCRRRSLLCLYRRFVYGDRSNFIR